MLKVNIKKIDRLKSILKRAEIKAGEKVYNEILKTAYQIQRKAVKDIAKLSRGEGVKSYRKGKGLPHIRSKKGDAPNTETGNLIRSIKVVMKKDSVIVGSNAPYAKILDDPNGLDRPFLKDNAKEISNKNFKKIKGVVKGSFK